MEQYLINKLWDHTYRSFEENSIKGEETYLEEAIKLRPSASPNVLYASEFFRNNDTLFMSFHPEGSNDHLHCHDFFELLYVCKGDPIGVINNQEIILQEGTLCIMNPNAVHYFKKYTASTDLVLNILLPKDLFQKSIYQILFNDPVLNAFLSVIDLKPKNRLHFYIFFI